ncbi:spectrin alpha chain, erythrocytic 1-like [Rousettus aegyptiacus]|uniref:spectrin alpha chain, erythrocytic 1-like n=1 Tax=Rousettus aegyptiacus TaxID=9407 RepID=UPI0007890995|nr:spectrin alpha chain, erythrocytic 1-like [Rousettus aegyptiacus]XP_015979682.1 spectrin alpha chain, erythrocytic 1-like [Rousettus aegyptiacus]
MKHQLAKIEDLRDNLKEALIQDIKYNTIRLAQQWDQLYQLDMQMQHNLEQQIQAKKSYLSLKYSTSFLIDKESEKIKSIDEIENTFQDLAAGKAYITKKDTKQG